MERIYLLASPRGFSNEVVLYVSEDENFINKLADKYNDDASAYADRISKEKALKNAERAFGIEYCDSDELKGVYKNSIRTQREMLLNICKKYTNADYIHI